MRALLAVALLLASASTAQANLRACQELYRAAPKTLGGTPMTGTANYEKEKRGSGYTVQFVRNDNDVASVFFYDRRQNRFSEKELATELSVAASNIFRLRASGRNVTDSDVFFDRPEKPTRGLFGLAFIHVVFDGRTRQHDFISLGSVNGCLVKLIYSTNGPRNRANRKFTRTLNDLLAYLEKS